MTNDITSELAKLHELTGVEFSRQVERIAKRKEFHPLETDKDIFTTGGEQSDDYENLLQTAHSSICLRKHMSDKKTIPCGDGFKNGVVS